MPSRRRFLAGAVGAGLCSLGAAPPVSAQSPAFAALREAVALGGALRRGEITQTGWQDRVAPVLRRRSVAELAAAIDLPALRARAARVVRGASILRVPLLDALDPDEGADVKVFFLRAGRSDPPHVHFNLVAAHIVLEGRFRVRHFSRLGEEDGGFRLRPSGDRELGPGELSSISDDRDNGHWHQALTDGVLLDVQQGRIDPTRPIRRREMIDPERARPLPDGALHARRLDRVTALRRYG